MNQEQVSKIIKKIRKDNNLTQAELAKKLNVTFQAVSKWENGKSIPDIETLNSISKEFNISLDEILGNKKTSKKKVYIVSILLVIFILITIGLYLILHKESFEFKTISSNCSEFSISGSAAYSKDKTSIYISNIEYCGNENNIVYKKIDCALYEKDNNKISQVSKCISKSNINLNDYLNSIKLSVDNYNSICKKISSADIYLEIKATDYDNKITEYNIPLKLSDNC